MRSRLEVDLRLMAATRRASFDVPSTFPRALFIGMIALGGTAGYSHAAARAERARIERGQGPSDASRPREPGVGSERSRDIAK